MKEVKKVNEKRKWIIGNEIQIKCYYVEGVFVDIIKYTHTQREKGGGGTLNGETHILIGFGTDGASCTLHTFDLLMMTI